jgi:NAD+--asparagine ADP-ribosyltransferase
VYVQIVSLEQRQRYKQDFNSEYNEYRELYSEMSQRMQIFKKLKDQLSKESGELREVSQLAVLRTLGRKLVESCLPDAF